MFARYALTFGRGAHRHRLLESARRERLAIVVENAGLLFVAEEGTPHVAGGGRLLVGQIFSPAGERIESLGELEIDDDGTISCAGTCGCWGNFALFEGASGGTAYREPSGAIPVYHCRAGDAEFFVSDAGLAQRLGLLGAASPDLTFAVHWLQYPFLRTSRTGLDTVSELLPGVKSGKDRSGKGILRPLWRPSHVLERSASIDNPATAAAALRDLALPIVGRQLARQRVLLELSGGLDSSIVAACLSTSDVEVRALNFATRSADGDERRHARAVAESLGIPLAEFVETGAHPIARPRPGFRPGINPLLQPFQDVVERAVRDHRGALLVDGAGGDNLFCFITSAAPAIDALRSCGIRQASRTALDIAARASCTWWEVAAAAAKKAVKPRPGWKQDRSFLRQQALLPNPEGHPWLAGLRHLPAGKREHVEALVHIQHFLDRGASPELGRMHPLMAQPLLELCLRIPTWLWVKGGRDRAVARDAFRDLLPAPILDRRSKGSLQSSFHRSFAAARHEMEELLMTGELARAGIIDTDAVGAALRARKPPSDELQLRITEMVALDLWLQCWTSDRARLASAA